jgi:hypothetical protein
MLLLCSGGRLGKLSGLVLRSASRRNYSCFTVCSRDVCDEEVYMSLLKTVHLRVVSMACAVLGAVCSSATVVGDGLTRDREGALC